MLYSPLICNQNTIVFLTLHINDQEYYKGHSKFKHLVGDLLSNLDIWFGNIPPI